MYALIYPAPIQDILETSLILFPSSSNHGNKPVEAEKAEAAPNKMFIAPGRRVKVSNTVREVWMAAGTDKVEEGPTRMRTHSTYQHKQILAS